MRDQPARRLEAKPFHSAGDQIRPVAAQCYCRRLTKTHAGSFTQGQIGATYTLTARNSGDRRLRISALTLRDSSGKSLSFGSGLAGYALGQSDVSWTVPRRGFAANGSAAVIAQSDGGPIQAVASIASR